MTKYERQWLMVFIAMGLTVVMLIMIFAGFFYCFSNYKVNVEVNKEIRR